MLRDLRASLLANISNMVKDKQRKIYTATEGALTKGRTPAKVKRYKKLSVKSRISDAHCERFSSIHLVGKQHLKTLINVTDPLILHGKCRDYRGACPEKVYDKSLPRLLQNDGIKDGYRENDAKTAESSNSTVNFTVGRDLCTLDSSNEKKKGPSILSGVTVAMDCEMVECVDNCNALARCSIVNYDGDVLLDVYVQQTSPVVDYRYKHSGISAKILRDNPCVTRVEARYQVKKLIEGKILVGHSLQNDFRTLGIDHPALFTIDLGSDELQAMLRTLLPVSSRKSSLEFLARTYLNKRIQVGRHCSVEDSIATMEIFKFVERLWVEQNEFVVSSITEFNSDSYFDDEYWPPDMENE